MKSKYPSISQALVLLLAGLAVSTAMVFGVSAFISKENLGSLPVTGVLNAFPMGLMVYAGYLIRGEEWGEVFPLQVPGLKDVFFLLAAGIGLSILGSEIDNLFRMLFPVPESMASFFRDLLVGGSVLSTLMLVSVIAPLGEEYLFRGIILKGFLEVYSTRRAIAVSSLLFALYHLNPWQFFGAFFGGLMLGWVRWRTGSLFHAILLHGIFNALPVMVLRSGPVIDGYNTPYNLQSFQPFWFDAAGGVLLASGIWYFSRKPVPEKENETEGRNV